MLVEMDQFSQDRPTIQPKKFCSQSGETRPLTKSVVIAGFPPE